MRELTRRGSFGDAFEVFPGVDSCGMTIAPDGLNGVAAHQGQPTQLKCTGPQFLSRSFVDISHDIHFSSTPRTGAASAED